MSHINWDQAKTDLIEYIDRHKKYLPKAIYLLKGKTTGKLFICYCQAGERVWGYFEGGGEPWLATHHIENYENVTPLAKIAFPKDIFTATPEQVALINQAGIPHLVVG